GMFTIWVGHVTLCMAFVAVIIQARVRDLDRSLEEAALDLGATPLTVFFRITLPLIAPALASAWLLSFTLSLDDVVVASFLSGPGSTTLPMEVFSRVRLGLKPEVNALATLFILGVGICVILVNRLQLRKASESKCSTKQPCMAWPSAAPASRPANGCRRMAYRTNLSTTATIPCLPPRCGRGPSSWAVGKNWSIAA